MLGWLYHWADGVRQRARRRRWTGTLASGRDGEDLAHRFLQKHGFTIVARNFKTRGGSAEIDLIGWDGPTLVFVEVKTRQTDEYGAPDRAIDTHKRNKIVFGALAYLRLLTRKPEGVRFDVVNVVLGADDPVTHWPDAFRPR